MPKQENIITEKRTGKVYKITSPSNRVYIGSTTQEVKKRWNCYFSLSCKSQPRIYRSLKKYGPKNHKFEVIWEGDVSILEHMERYYGDLFEALHPKKGLNCSLPGNDIVKKITISKKFENISNLIKKAVLMYDKNKNFIKRFDSTVEAAEYAGTQSSEIVRSCQDNKTTAKGYIFIYEKNIADLDLHTGFGRIIKKPINVYDLDGKFICFYESTHQMVKLKNFQRSEVFRVCTDCRGSHRGFQFRYRINDDNSDISAYVKRKSAKSKKVIMYDIDWNVLRIFDSVTEAYTLTDDCENGVYKSCKYNGRPTTLNNRFMYYERVEQSQK